MEALKDIAPDLGNYIVEFAFDEIYAREGLSFKEREMITLASLLTAGGCEPQLEVHIQGRSMWESLRKKSSNCFYSVFPIPDFPGF